MAENKKTILLVDDDAIFLESMSELLALSSYKIVAASNPTEAIRLLKMNPDAIDLLLTDREMDKNENAGFALAKAAREIKPDLPVILNSTNTSYPGKKVIYERQLAAAGGGIVLCKTQRIAEYKQAISALLDRSRAP